MLISLVLSFGIEDRDSSRRDYGRDSVLEDKLLFSVALNDNGIAVEALYHSLELKAVGKKYRYGNFLFSCMIQKNILQIQRLVHSFNLSFLGYAAADPSSEETFPGIFSFSGVAFA